MEQLAAMFVAAGCTKVRTYIQSGNVVFNAPPAVAKRVPEMVAQAIVEQCDFQAPVVLRSLEELEDLSRRNPFLKSGADAAALHLAFLASAPSASQIAALDPSRSPPDEFIAQGKDVYLLLPNGVGRTKLTNEYFDRKLGTISTLRNWRTVLQLLEMAKGGE